MFRKRDLIKVRNHSGADTRLVLEAAFFLALARIAILTMPFRWTICLLPLEPGDGNPQEPVSCDPDSIAFARRARWALKAAAFRTPWRSNCLTKALAGIGMLRFRHISGIMALGVDTGTHSGNLRAHAWLTVGEVIVTGAGPHRNHRLIARFAYNPKVSASGAPCIYTRDSL